MTGERREKIRYLLSEKPFVSLEELTEMFPDVSDMTLRRDIEYFESIGVAIKVRGGARSMKFIGDNTEDSISRRMYTNIEEKTAIAKMSVRFLEPGRSIFFDAGSTIERVARLVPPERMVFTTTSPSIAIALCKPGVHVINIAGGRIDRDNLAVSGMYAVKFIEGMNIDIAFLSPSGLSLNGDFSCGNYSDCELKKLVCGKARKVIMLMDHTKIDRTLPFTFCDFSNIDILITDKPLPHDLAKMAANAGCTVIDGTENKPASDGE